MTKKEIVQILALLSSAYPNTRIDPETTANLWYSLYCNEDFEIAKKATEFVIRNNRFFPSHKDFGDALTRFKYLASIPQPKYEKLPESSECNNLIKGDILELFGE